LRLIDLKVNNQTQLSTLLIRGRELWQTRCSHRQWP